MGKKILRGHCLSHGSEEFRGVLRTVVGEDLRKSCGGFVLSSADPEKAGEIVPCSSVFCSGTPAGTCFGTCFGTCSFLCFPP